MKDQKIQNTHLLDLLQHVVDSHHGQYSGQIFAEYFDNHFKNGFITGINSDDWQCLLNGPNDEFYLDSWSNLDNIEIIIDRIKYVLIQNEGMYLFPANEVDKVDWDEFLI